MNPRNDDVHDDSGRVTRGLAPLVGGGGAVPWPVRVNADSLLSQLDSSILDCEGPVGRGGSW